MSIVNKKTKKIKKSIDKNKKHGIIINIVRKCRCSSMVELQPSKLTTWVRFPSPAPYEN